MNRRGFLGRTAAAGAWLSAPWIRSARAAGGPNGQPNFLAIGVRNRGAAIAIGSCAYGRIVACCDVDKTCIDKFFGHLGKKQKDPPQVYTDYREALARKDVDAVTIGTPDHWHAAMIIDAVRAGKDVYVEKPMTLTVGEGREVCRVVRASDRVVQVGTQQRSEYEGGFLKAVALARLGHIGPRITATVVLPPRYGKGGQVFPFVPVPEGLDWDRWLGPAPKSEYCPQRCHGSWRMWVETGCGPLTDWGVHHVDIAAWALNPDPDAPVEVAGAGSFPHGRQATLDAILGRRPYASLPNGFSTVTDYEAVIRFAGGHEIRIDGHGGEPKPGRGDNGLELAGERGTLWVTRSGKETEIRGTALDAGAKEPGKVMDEMIRLYKGRTPRWAAPKEQIGDIVPTAHMDDFVACMRSRAEPVSDVASHHRVNTLCQLTHIAMLVGRPVRWDPKTETIVSDPEAAALLSRQPRAGWELPA